MWENLSRVCRSSLCKVGQGQHERESSGVKVHAVGSSRYVSFKLTSAEVAGSCLLSFHTVFSHHFSFSHSHLASFYHLGAAQFCSLFSVPPFFSQAEAAYLPAAVVVLNSSATSGVMTCVCVCVHFNPHSLMK